MGAEPQGSCVVLMTPPNPLQKLRDLDRTSPHFHKQLTDFLRGDEYRDAAPSLQGKGLVWFVNYPDNVDLRTVSSRSTLIAGAGPRRYLQSQHHPISGTARRAPKDMRCQECPPKHVHTFEFTSGMRV